MSEELKPCPFCGGTDLDALDMEGKHYVVCYDCALEGPFHDSRAAVVKAWNRRAAVAQPAGANFHAHHVAVDKAALQMVRNALRNDVEAGRVARGEMLAELDKATFQIPAPAA